MLRRKNICILIIVVLLILISLSGCTGVEVETVNIEISFDPDPVHCENDHLYWDVIISETNGIGVNLKSITKDAYVGDHYTGNSKIFDESWIEEACGTSYLSAFSSVNYSAGASPCEWNVGVTLKYKVTGIDDNGRQVEATADLELMD
jgi:hypothetical protein